MRILISKHIPFKGYVAMTILWWCIIREEYKDYFDEKCYRHENTHSYQQIVLFLTSFAITSIVHIFWEVPWWIYAITLTLPLIIYVLCWIAELILPPYDRAYRDICFEGEARELESDLDYQKRLYPFSFLKYVKNKKYGGR